MNLNDYQQIASRTINRNLSRTEMLDHSLFGMCSEVGEIHGIYQKVFQGHKVRKIDLMYELGDLLWFIAEFCTVNGWHLEEIAQMNAEKLFQRYPDGFSEEMSVNRDENLPK